MKTVGRSAGRSATAAAAYRSGTEITDERTDEVHDYSRRRGVEHTEIVGWTGSRAELWNAAELAERRVDSRVARELVIALPHELSRGERIGTARAMAQQLRERYGVAVDVAVHAPSERGDQRNHHAHLLFTTRQVAGDGFGPKTRALDVPRTARDEVHHIREVWAGIANGALAQVRAEERVTARSLEARGIGRQATQHMGARVTEMERQGIPSRIGDENRRRIQVGELEIYGTDRRGRGREEGEPDSKRTNPPKEGTMAEVVAEQVGTGGAGTRAEPRPEPKERSAGSTAAREGQSAHPPAENGAGRAKPGLDPEAVKKDFAAARSWKELEDRLEARGARIEPREGGKGIGLAVTSGGRETPLSKMNQRSAELNERFGQTYTEYRKGQAAEQQEAAGRTPDRDGTKEAEKPTGKASEKLDPAVQKLVDEVKIYERARNADRHIRQAVAEAGSARQEVHALRDALSRAEVRRSQFDRALEKTYKNPGVARDVFVQAAAEHGAERARELMEKKPELYGELAEQRRILGLVRETRTARDAARGAAEAGKEYLETRAAAPNAERMKAAEQRLEVANRQLREMVAENKLPPVQTLERSIGRRAAALTPAQQKQLQRAIPAPSLGTVMTAARIVREQGNVMER